MNNNSSKFRADVTSIKEMRWSSNSLEHETYQSAQAYLDGLSERWTGFDMSRIVPVDTPKNEQVDLVNHTLYQNFRN